MTFLWGVAGNSKPRLDERKAVAGSRVLNGTDNPYWRADISGPLDLDALVEVREPLLRIVRLHGDAIKVGLNRALGGGPMIMPAASMPIVAVTASSTEPGIIWVGP